MRLPIYFLSDVHLQTLYSPAEEQKLNRLFEFFECIRRQQATLFIVGDLFDFWFEYRSAIFACYFRVLRELQNLVDSGCDVHFIGGNHDYWAGDFLQKEIGLKLHFEPVNVEINAHRFHITHADGILRNDRGYRLLRAVLRNTFIIRLFRHLHPDWALYIARKVSGKSRHLNLRPARVISRDRADLIAYGEAQLAAGADFVVTGHLHLPTIEYRNDKVILNLGDWMRYFSFAYYDGTLIRLAYWNINQSSGC